MLSDIVKISQEIFPLFLENNQSKTHALTLYDVYRCLNKVNSNINLVATHYLAVDFSSPFLQNSSFGAPEEKWKYFLNKDLKTLNESVKKFLLKIRNIAIIPNDEEIEKYFPFSILYKDKTYYEFVRDIYNIGHIDCSCKFLILDILSTEFDPDNYYLTEFKKIDLSTFENRLQLKNNILARYEILKQFEIRLSDYISTNYTISDLMKSKY